MLDGGLLFKFITNDPELRGIPLIYVIKIAKSVIEAINSGECYVDTV